MSTAAVMSSTHSVTLPPLNRLHILRPPPMHTLPTPPSSATPSPSPSYRAMDISPPFRFYFERLPLELQREILSRLDYQSLIALSRVNRYFHQTIDPARLASPEDKFAFVMHAENYFTRHFPVVVQGQERPGNFACYACFRVRGPAHFDAEQPQSIWVNERGDRVPECQGQGLGRGGGKNTKAPTLPPPGCREVTLRRFCIECGVRHGLHRPGDSMFTKLRQELWVCGCKMVWQKPTCLKCTRCGGDCPLRAKAKS